ncbi:hypothetical protein K488DRAFT_84026 [Vararia minispora EC-137]|uniref:Uncharacterized protein n=1 Tax=Vararia minispora EC-137 TaxID=1314806 RepID=A0ACB8QRD8_9AGAM|nr:hypothetical protein K488DRAFT_84026 [Vararia minispora EC-137]
MAVLVEDVAEDSIDLGRREPSFESLLESIRIPPEYARYQEIGDPLILDSLMTWKAQTLDRLHSLREALHNEKLTDTKLAQAIFLVTPFLSENKWSSDAASTIVREILEYFDVRISLLEVILTSKIKPAFQATNHPMLNSQTGRALNRPVGGSMAAHDMYEGQVWKSYLGIEEVLIWCLERIPTDAYDRLWYLVVPPTMTLLDDYEMRYKVAGTRAVDAVLRTAPPDLLLRTGVADLFFTSLKRALTLLHSPDTPALLRAAALVAVELVSRTSPVGSEERFNRLCELLGDGIIGSVWVYAYRDPNTIEASVDVLPPLFEALGIGVSRYLKAIIPQLTHPLRPSFDRPPHTSLQLASLSALQIVVRVCAPRMYRWKGAVLESIATRWVMLADSGCDDRQANQLRGAMRSVCIELLRAVPGDYDRLLDLNETMFITLFDISSTSYVPTEAKGG